MKIFYCCYSYSGYCDVNTRLVQKKKIKNKTKNKVFFFKWGHDAKIAYHFDLRYFQTANNALQTFQTSMLEFCFPFFCQVSVTTFCTKRKNAITKTQLSQKHESIKMYPIQYVAPGPDEKDANVYFLPQKNSNELKFVLQFTVTFP